MSKELECVSDFTSIVMCQHDWKPISVDHVGRGLKIGGIINIQDDPNIKGYLRLWTANEDYLLVVAGDWGVVQ